MTEERKKHQRKNHREWWEDFGIDDDLAGFKISEQGWLACASQEEALRKKLRELASKWPHEWMNKDDDFVHKESRLGAADKFDKHCHRCQLEKLLGDKP